MDDKPKPIIIIDGGQRAGSETTNVILVLLQQLVACDEYSDMLLKVKWVLLPCVNPDGMEYSTYVSTLVS